MNLNKSFYKSVIPAICAMLVSGLYIVVDGIFVGRGVGTEGLAAVNIALPYISIMTAVSMMLSMGGATLTSIYFGKGDKEKANNAFLTTIFLIVGFSLALTVISVTMPEAISRLLGASDALIPQTATYIRYYVMFGIFFCGALSLSAFVKNDGNPNLAMYGMIVGAISNIFLDWLFIFPLQMGIMGAAIASGLGQVLSVLVLSTHFIRKKGDLRLALPKREKGLIKEIAKVGAPEFVTQMSQPVIILCYNFIVMEIFGEIGISAFSVVGYLITIIIAAFIGLAQGIQPLISRSLGEEKLENVKLFFKKGLVFNVLMSAVIYGVLLLFGRQIISIFNSDPNLIDIAYNSIKIYGISFIFAAVNIVYITYFLATKKTKQSLTIAILRSFIVNTICIMLVPAIFGSAYVWGGIVAAEVIAMLISLAIGKKTKLEITHKQVSITK